MTALTTTYRITRRIPIEDAGTLLHIDTGTMSSGNLANFVKDRKDYPGITATLAPTYGNPAPDLDPVTGEPLNGNQPEVTSPVTFYLFDHLGNTRVTFRSDASDAISITYAADYYPYGKILREYNCNQNRYLSTHHERDVATGYDNRGARLYDSEIGRFLGVDPMAMKFKSWSPFQYVYGRPTNVVDPDGEEGIVVSGQPGDHKNRLHFLENGLDRSRKMSRDYAKQKSSEQVTWIIYNNGDPENGGYSQNELSGYLSKAEAAGIQVMIVGDSDEIVDYVNEKDGGDSREEDKVSNFTYVGHAMPASLGVGYIDHGMINEVMHDALKPKDFDADAFSDDSCGNLVGGCRTAQGTFYRKSAAEQLADKVGGKVKASDVRVYYSGGVVSDKALVKKNNGKVVEIEGRKNN